MYIFMRFLAAKPYHLLASPMACKCTKKYWFIL